jgi:2-octaprenyl-6-methoxyphenol hydroxylase
MHERGMSKTPLCLIAGSGSVGLMLALRLKQKLGERLHVHIFDPQREEKRDMRAYALNRCAVNLLSEAGLWDEAGPDLSPITPLVTPLGKEAQPVHSMRIGDSNLQEPVRSVFLTFDEDEGTPLAHVVEGYRLKQALKQACLNAGIPFFPAAVTDFSIQKEGLHVHTGDGRTIEASLLVAADGVRSSLREWARIGLVRLDYAQTAIVATLNHEHDHEGAAIQHFLPHGPFALLPLPSKDGVFRSSLVWSESRAGAQDLMALDRIGFEKAVSSAAGAEWGAFTLEEGPYTFPLSLGLARNWTAPFFALLGDAAHHIHPLAGQGLNLGLQDAGVLADEIIASVMLGCAPGSQNVLKTYERRCRPPALAMAALTTGLNSLFSNDSGLMRFLRQTGLGLTQQAEPMRRFLIRKAGGN